MKMLDLSILRLKFSFLDCMCNPRIIYHTKRRIQNNIPIVAKCGVFNECNMTSTCLYYYLNPTNKHIITLLKLSLFSPDRQCDRESRNSCWRRDNHPDDGSICRVSSSDPSCTPLCRSSCGCCLISTLWTVPRSSSSVCSWGSFV